MDTIDFEDAYLPPSRVTRVERLVDFLAPVVLRDVLNVSFQNEQEYFRCHIFMEHRISKEEVIVYCEFVRKAAKSTVVLKSTYRLCFNEAEQQWADELAAFPSRKLYHHRPLRCRL
jgi:hypothetical protein